MIRVSVIVPCFDYGHYLEEAVASVLAQGIDGLEVIVVDDGSTDDSLAVARRLAAAHPEVEVVAQANAGQPAIARNNGIARSRGAYVVCLDADDVMGPGMLRGCMAVLDADPSVGMAYPRQENFGAESGTVAHLDWDPVRLARCNYMPTATMLRREAFDAAGGYSTNVRGYEDWDLWLGCVDAGWPGRPARDAVWRYRLHGASLYGDAKQRDQRLKAQVVLNRRGCFGRGVIAWAEGVLAGDDAALAVPSQVGWVPDLPDPRGALRVAAAAAPGAAAHVTARLHEEGVELGAAPADWVLDLPAGHAVASPFPGGTVRELVELADALGYAAIPVRPAGEARRPGADGPVFPLALLALEPGAEEGLGDARASVLAQSTRALLIGHGLRGQRTAGVGLDAGALARFTGVAGHAVEELVGAASLGSKLHSAGDAPEPAPPARAAALAAMGDVLEAESVLRGDAGGAARGAAYAGALRRQGLDGARTVAVLAYADELLERPALLEAFGAAFGAGDDVTLAIVCPGDPDPLARLVAEAGLEHEDACDLLAVPSEPAGPDAVFTLRTSAPSGVPAYGPDGLGALAALVARRSAQPS